MLRAVLCVLSRNYRYGTEEKSLSYLFGKADVVIVLSNFWKEKVNECFGLGEKVRVVYNPCTSEVFPAEYPKKKQILYAGTVSTQLLLRS